MLVGLGALAGLTFAFKQNAGVLLGVALVLGLAWLHPTVQPGPCASCSYSCSCWWWRRRPADPPPRQRDDRRIFHAAAGRGGLRRAAPGPRRGRWSRIATVGWRGGVSRDRLLPGHTAVDDRAAVGPQLGRQSGQELRWGDQPGRAVVPAMGPGRYGVGDRAGAGPGAAAADPRRALARQTPGARACRRVRRG